MAMTMTINVIIDTLVELVLSFVISVVEVRR